MEEAVFQLFMNNIMVGNTQNQMQLDQPIKRSEVMKMIIKPLFELDEDAVQILANVDGNSTNIINITASPQGYEYNNIVFDREGKRQFTITINQNDTNKYCIETFGGLIENEEVELIVKKNNVIQPYAKKYGHKLYEIQGAGEYEVTVEYDGVANIGLKVYPLELPTLEFKKSEDSNFIYVNSPEYITRFDMTDNAEYDYVRNMIPKAKLFELENVTGKNTFYETHLSWYGLSGNQYVPLSQFYLDIDMYNPTNENVVVSIENLVYSVSFNNMRQYFNNGHNFDIVIAPYNHALILSNYESPLLCTNPNGSSWARTPAILFDFTVQNGNVTVSSLAAYNTNNLYLRNGTKNIVDSTGAELDSGGILFGDNNGVIEWGFGEDPRPNETDLYAKVKGIAKNQSAWIDSELDFVIDEDTNLDELQPIKLKDDFYTYGIANPKWSWMSSLSPIFDQWYGAVTALPGGIHNFIYPYLDTGREWTFDFRYRNLKHVDLNGTRLSVNDPVSDQIIDYVKQDMAIGEKEHFRDWDAEANEYVYFSPDGDATGVGEWGATYHYTLTVSNTTNCDKLVKIAVWAAENMAFGFKLLDSTEYFTRFYNKIENTPDDPSIATGFTVHQHQTVTFEFVTMLCCGSSGIGHGIIIDEIR